MQYLKVTHVDAITRVSVITAPAANGPDFPAVDGLAIEWARESAFPTTEPEYFGTCPDESDTAIDGVLAVLSQAEYDSARLAEQRARVPAKVTRRQALQALRIAGLRDLVQPAIDAIPDPLARDLAQIEWDESLEFERHRPLLIQLGNAIGLDDDGLDALFVQAAAL